MNKEQTLLLNLLIKLDAFFSENGITYYLDGGTAIGALRHNGFLPWDDDADIYITRDNYHKLLKVANKLNDINVILACHELYPQYNKVAIKFTDLNDTSFVKSDMFHGMAMGQNIDIFILDPVPKQKIDEYYAYFHVYNELLTYSYVVNQDIVKNIKQYKKYLRRMKIKGREKVLKELESKFTRFSEEESDMYALRWGEIPIVYEKEIFGKPRMVRFENHLFPAARRTEDFLRTQFGDDWKIIPQGNMRITHNIYINHDIPGINYFDDFKRFVNLNEAEKILKKRKKFWLMKLPAQMELQKKQDDYGSLCFEVRFVDIWESNGCAQLFKKKRYCELLNAFQEIESTYKCLTDEKDFYSNHKKEIETILYLWCISGKFYIAEKFMKAMDIIKNPDLNFILSLIKINRAISILMENHQYEDALKLIRPYVLREEFSENKDLMCAYIFLKINIFNSNHNDECKEILDKLMKLFPNDGELIKLMGDYESKKGNLSKAYQLYDNAAKSTYNGLILLELEQKYGIVIQ